MCEKYSERIRLSGSRYSTNQNVMAIETPTHDVSVVVDSESELPDWIKRKSYGVLDVG
jgi:hypothetical protein